MAGSQRWSWKKPLQQVLREAPSAGDSWVCGLPLSFPLPSWPALLTRDEVNLGAKYPVSLAKPGACWGRGTWAAFPLPLGCPDLQSAGISLAASALPFSVSPGTDLPTTLQLPHPWLRPHPTPVSPHLVWVSLVGRPGGCWKDKVPWSPYPCPCCCQGPCASACMCECSPAAHSTGSSLSSTVSFSL